jgi:hypothetical protein
MDPLSNPRALTYDINSNFYLGEQKTNMVRLPSMDEGRKRVLAIVAGILVARHLKTTEDLFDSKSSPRTESLVAAAVQWAERIMRKIDGVYR